MKDTLKKTFKKTMKKISSTPKQTVVYILIASIAVLLIAIVCVSMKRKEAAFLFPPPPAGAGAGAGTGAGAGAASSEDDDDSVASFDMNDFVAASDPNVAAEASAGVVSSTKGTVADSGACVLDSDCADWVSGDVDGMRCRTAETRGKICKTLGGAAHVCWKDLTEERKKTERSWASGDSNLMAFKGQTAMPASMNALRWKYRPGTGDRPQDGCECKTDGKHSININGICFGNGDGINDLRKRKPVGNGKYYRLKAFMRGRKAPIGYIYSAVSGGSRWDVKINKDVGTRLKCNDVNHEQHGVLYGKGTAVIIEHTEKNKTGSGSKSDFRFFRVSPEYNWGITMEKLSDGYGVGSKAQVNGGVARSGRWWAHHRFLWKWHMGLDPSNPDVEYVLPCEESKHYMFLPTRSLNDQVKVTSDLNHPNLLYFQIEAASQ